MESCWECSLEFYPWRQGSQKLRVSCRQLMRRKWRYVWLWQICRGWGYVDSHRWGGNYGGKLEHISEHRDPAPSLNRSLPKAKLITPMAWNIPLSKIENLPTWLPFNSGGTWGPSMRTETTIIIIPTRAKPEARASLWMSRYNDRG